MVCEVFFVSLLYLKAKYIKKCSDISLKNGQQQGVISREYSSQSIQKPQSSFDRFYLDQITKTVIIRNLSRIDKNEQMARCHIIKISFFLCKHQSV